MKAVNKSCAGFFALLALGVAGSASAITINYDLDTGVPSQPPTAILEQYSSAPISFAAQSASGPFQLIINFVDTQTGGPQLLQLRNFGQGFPFPTTFGAIDVGAINMHSFGPSMTLSSTGPASGNAAVTVTPKNEFGSTGPVASSFGTGSATCSGTTCPFGVIFPDLIDGNGLLEFSGLTFDFTFSGASPDFSVDSLAFNVISPTSGPQGSGEGISILQLPAASVPEPTSLGLLSFALVALGMARRRR
jgi:hypothetical protein